MDTSELWMRVEGLAANISMEVGFAQPEKDLGLLPVNALLSEIEELSAQNAFPEPFPEAIRYARGVVDDSLLSGGFSSAGLQGLSSWASWTQRAAVEMRGQSALPPLPDRWGSSGTVADSSPLPPPAADANGAVGTVEGEQALVLNVESDGDLLREFINESQEHLQNIELGVLTLEHSPTDHDTLNSIFRAFHTFKGGSGFLNLVPINLLAHELESLLDLARRHELAITSDVIEVILEGADTLKRFVSEISRQLAGETTVQPIQIPIQQQIATIRHKIQTGDAVAEPPTKPSPVPIEGPRQSVSTSQAPDGDASKHVSTEIAKGVENTPAGETGAKSGSTMSVKVDITKLDSLVDLVGEMVISQAMLAQDKTLQGIESQSLARNLAQLSRNTKDLQRIAMSLRMVPVRMSFQKMNRLVRDLATRQGKQVELVLSGEDTELDRTIVEEIGDPLVHMIRNSMDHGIERPEVRVSQGKPAAGTIRLSAYHQGGNIVIQIQDDGAGLDPERILRKAIQVGLVKEGETLEEKEIFALIFAPGFSTAEKITDISGRGVGMDVVKRNIEKLRGKIEIESVLGKGSTFSLYLPLTLAIIDGLIVVVGNERFVVPTLSVRESFRPKSDAIARVHGRGEMINVRGRFLPLLRLQDHFGIESNGSDPNQCIAVVVESGLEARCILVDQLLGKQEVVIKSLGEMFKENRALAGAAILGDGRVGLILDPNTLVNLSPNRMCQAA